MNFWEKIKDSRWLPNTIAVCSGVLLYLFLTHVNMIGVALNSIWSLAAPLVLGVFLAYMMDPIVRFFEKKGLARTPAVLVMLLCLLVIVALLVALILPQLVNGVLQFIENVGYYLTRLEQKINALGIMKSSDTTSLTDQISSLMDQISQLFSGKNLQAASQGAGGSIGSGVATFGISFILAIYYLMSKKTLVTWTQQFIRYVMKDEPYERLASFCSRCNDILLRYISCSLIEALIVGLANAAFMVVTRMPYISVISCVVGVTNLAPTFGPIVGAVIGALILLLVQPQCVIPFLIFTLILQTIDGYVIKPKLFGNTLGVSSLLILIFLVLGGRILGIWGILFAIPLAAIFQYLVTEIIFPAGSIIPENGQGGTGRKAFSIKEFLATMKHSGEK